MSYYNQDDLENIKPFFLVFIRWVLTGIELGIDTNSKADKVGLVDS